MMLERFRHILEGVPASRFLLAVSGGVDSMTMAELFLSVLPCDSIGVANCNFHLRGDESDGDSEFVRQWTLKKGLRLFQTDFDTQTYASQNGISLEMAARDLRYNWFTKLCSEEGYDAVAVAHNANDNAETLILNLLRGTGLKGLCGMKTCAAMEPGVLLLRPLLTFSRREIEEYALSNGIHWREDSTNSCVEYKRNRVRCNLFPEFEQLNPSFVDTLSRDMEHFAQAQSVLESWVESVRKNVCGRDTSGNVTLDARALRSCDHPEYALYQILQPYGFNSATLKGALQAGPGKKFFSSEYVLLSTASGFTLAERFRGRREESLTVDGPGEYVLGSTRFMVRCEPYDSEVPLIQPRGTVMFDSGILHFPLTFRRWRDGDWMCPLGMKGRKKLSDLFVDLKYSVIDKSSALVLAFDEGSRVASLVGERIDSKIKVTSSCENVTIIKIL